MDTRTTISVLIISFYHQALLIDEYKVIVRISGKKSHFDDSDIDLLTW